MELKASYPLQVYYGDSRIIIDRKALHLSFNDVMKVRILRIPIAPYLGEAGKISIRLFVRIAPAVSSRNTLGRAIATKLKPFSFHSVNYSMLETHLLHYK